MIEESARQRIKKNINPKICLPKWILSKKKDSGASLFLLSSAKRCNQDACSERRHQRKGRRENLISQISSSLCDHFIFYKDTSTSIKK